MIAKNGKGNASNRAMYSGIVPGKMVSAIFDKDADGAPYVVFVFAPTVPGNIRVGEAITNTRSLCLTDSDDKQTLRQIAAATGWNAKQVGIAFRPDDIKPVMLNYRYRPAMGNYSERCDLDGISPAYVDQADEDLIGSILAGEPEETSASEADVAKILAGEASAAKEAAEKEAAEKEAAKRAAGKAVKKPTAK